MLERHFSNKPLRNDRSAAGIAERESFSLKMQSKSKALYGLYFPHLTKSFTFVLWRVKRGRLKLTLQYILYFAAFINLISLDLKNVFISKCSNKIN